MRMIVDPLTGRRLNKNTRLEFNWRSMRFDSLTPGERLIQITPLKKKEKVKIVIGHGLGFDPLKGKYILLKEREKLVYDGVGGKFVIKEFKASVFLKVQNIYRSFVNSLNPTSMFVTQMESKRY